MNEKDFEDHQRLIQAKRKLNRIKLFYIHLAGYLVVVSLIVYNFYIMEDTPYTDSIIAINVSTLVLWTAFIILHGWRAFRGTILFGKKWEQRKMKAFMQEDNQKWE